MTRGWAGWLDGKRSPIVTYRSAFSHPIRAGAGRAQGGLFRLRVPTARYHRERLRATHLERFTSLGLMPPWLPPVAYRPGVADTTRGTRSSGLTPLGTSSKNSLTMQGIHSSQAVLLRRCRSAHPSLAAVLALRRVELTTQPSRAGPDKARSGEARSGWVGPTSARPRSPRAAPLPAAELLPAEGPPARKQDIGWPKPSASASMLAASRPGSGHTRPGLPDQAP